MDRKSLLLLLGGLPLLTNCTSTPSAPLPPTPQTRIGELALAFTSAWNVHDPQAFSQTFAPAAQFTNVYGVHANGRPAIEAFHAKVFATVFKNSHQTTDSIDILSLDAYKAQVNVHWSMTGATIPNWPAVQHGIISWTLAQQKDGSWLIDVMTNAIAT